MDDAAPISPAPHVSGFTHARTLGAAEAEAVRAGWAAKGMRPLPYPFGSAMAFVSDIDSSNRPRYEGYVGEIVEGLGLDFGDSTWLHWQYFLRPLGPAANAFGFFNPCFSLGRADDPALFVNTRTFNESIAEFHKGNVDHFHAYSSRGPRVALIEKLGARTDGVVEIAFAGVQTSGPWSCRDTFVLGICIVGAPGKTFEVASIEVEGEDGQFGPLYRPHPYSPPPNGRRHRLFVAAPPADEANPAPLLERLRSIRIRTTATGDAAHIERVMLLSSWADLLVERLRLLRDRFGVQANLVTEHGKFHFRGPASTRIGDEALREEWNRWSGPPQAYNGTLVDDDGSLIFSTDAAEPHSFGRVFPEVSRDLELRFVNPVAAMKSTGWDPLSVLAASPMTEDAGVYWAHRTIRNVQEPLPGRHIDGVNSRQDTLVQRLVLVLEDMEREPGLFWPIYTHLGSWTKNYEDSGVVDSFGRALPSPYFEPGPMQALQDRVFGISGRAPPRSRVWFTRGSVLYDYALMLRSVGDHVTRRNGDTVAIASWRDQTLAKTLPRSPAQLYGLTFHVDDPSAACVLLDETPIETLGRNGPDESGQPSVTILECGIGAVLFDRLDPAANGGADCSGGAWSWRPADGAERAGGRLTVGWERGVAELAVSLEGWGATGAQVARFAARRERGAHLGITLETHDGGLFFFGERAVAARLDRTPTAAYFLDRHRLSEEGWATIAAPFHDMEWDARARAGGPMPSHALRRLSLLCVGPKDVWADFAGLSLLRPRTDAGPAAPERGYCLGGHVDRFVVAQEVKLAPAQGSAGAERTIMVDQRGWFCFEAVDAGVYRLWSPSPAGDVHDRRGALVEVAGHRMDLALGAARQTRP